MLAITNVVLCCVFVILWSSGWIGAKFGIGLTGPFSFLTWRYCLVVIALALFVFLAKKWKPISREEWTRHLQVGFLSHGVFLSASFGSLQFGVSAGMVAFVTAMQPLFTAVLSDRFVGEAPAPRQWVGIILGITAVGLVVADQISVAGGVMAYVLLLGSVLAISIATLLDRNNNIAKQKQNQELTPLPQVMLIHSVSALSLFALLAFALEGFQTTWSYSLIAVTLYMTIFLSIGSYLCMFLLLRRISVTRFAALAYMAPPVTMTMAWLFFNETLSVVQWSGLALAAIAVTIVYRFDGTSTIPKTTPDGKAPYLPSHNSKR